MTTPGELVAGLENLLVRAVRRPGRDRARALRDYRMLKGFLRIDPALERLLADLLEAAA